MDYKNTLNLPRTDFPMKADLVAREPDRLKKWETAGLYEKIQAARAPSEGKVCPARRPALCQRRRPHRHRAEQDSQGHHRQIQDPARLQRALHSGLGLPRPAHRIQGFPGHAQGRRHQSPTPSTIRKACEAYARKYIDIQRAQFKRLGVLGDWDNPYLTLNKEYEADELRLFADIVEKGFVYRGKKPVYWSIPCRTALAEAEVEYQDHVSQSIYREISRRRPAEDIRADLDDDALDFAGEPRCRLQRQT